MSNYHHLEMERAFHLCEAHGLTKPSVYQGLYNPLNRRVERELMPLLKKNRCDFVAYNPLAGGLLVGKHRPEAVVPGRFENNPNYLPRYYTEENFRAVDLLKRVCEEEGTSLLEATFKWMLRHSALSEDDGVLLGASSIEQVEQNLAACTKAGKEEEGLSEKVLSAFDQAWAITEGTSFKYWRGFSKDMPGRETMDHGASYNAAKTKA